MIFRHIDADLRRLYRHFLPHKWKLLIACVFLLCSASMSSITATLLGKITDAGFYNQEEWVIYGFLPHKWKLLIACVFLLCSASMSSITATLLGKITDAGFYNQEEWVIYGAPLTLIGVTLGFAISTVMSTYMMAQVSQAVLVTLRTQMFERILHWPEKEYQANTSGRICSKFVNEATMALSGAVQSFVVLVRTQMFERILHWPEKEYQANTSGRICSKFVNEATMALSGAVQSFVVLVRDSVQVLALLGVLFWHDWKLTLVTFVIIPGLALTLRTISRRVRRIVAESQETLGSMLSRVQESYEAERLIKVSNTYDFEEKRFASVNMNIRRLSLKLIKMQSITTPITQLLTMVAIACVVGVALWQAQKGLLTIGEFITFLSALLLIKAPIQHLSGLNGTFASISVAAKSIFDTLDAEVERDEGKTVLENVIGLRYPDQPNDALTDINLTIKAGEHLAIVGPSGSGKTSLVNLLPRFLELTSGRITLDGVDIRELTLENLRQQISFVTQDVVLFDDTIRHNLT